MNKEVKKYYDRLAKSFNSNRFSNTYGKFIHNQELAFIESYKFAINDTRLNLGCGTGRFMEFCTHGYDISNKMIDEARIKFPNKDFTLGYASKTPYLDHSFDNIICLHVIMYLSQNDTDNLINEALRLLKPGGRLIIDHPSLKRRRLFNYKNVDWHGSNEYSALLFDQLINGRAKTMKKMEFYFFPFTGFQIK